jgi:hypothetical protein
VALRGGAVSGGGAVGICHVATWFARGASAIAGALVAAIARVMNAVGSAWVGGRGVLCGERVDRCFVVFTENLLRSMRLTFSANAVDTRGA